MWGTFHVIIQETWERPQALRVQDINGPGGDNNNPRVLLLAVVQRPWLPELVVFLKVIKLDVFDDLRSVSNANPESR